MRRAETKRFVKFAMVGVLGTLTHFTFLNLLVQIGGWSEFLANSVGFCIAVVQNFFLNRYWTYPESRGRDARRQLAQFFLVSMIGLVLNLVVFRIVHWLVEPFYDRVASSPAMANFLTYNTAFFGAVGVVLFWNFAANRLWTYRGLSKGETGAIAPE